MTADGDCKLQRLKGRRAGLVKIDKMSTRVSKLPSSPSKLCASYQLACRRCSADATGGVNNVTHSNSFERGSGAECTTCIKSVAMALPRARTATRPCENAIQCVSRARIRVKTTHNSKPAVSGDGPVNSSWSQVQQLQHFDCCTRPISATTPIELV